jgi:hypothetical protein
MHVRSRVERRQGARESERARLCVCIVYVSQNVYLCVTVLCFTAHRCTPRGRRLHATACVAAADGSAQRCSNSNSSSCIMSCCISSPLGLWFGGAAEASQCRVLAHCTCMCEHSASSSAVCVCVCTSAHCTLAERIGALHFACVPAL